MQSKIIFMAAFTGFIFLLSINANGQDLVSQREKLLNAESSDDFDLILKGEELTNQACEVIYSDSVACEFDLRRSDLVQVIFNVKDRTVITSDSFLKAMDDREIKTFFAWMIEFSASGRKNNETKKRKNGICPARNSGIFRAGC